MMNPTKKLGLSAIVLVVALSQSSCLKTRAQLKDDGDEGGSQPISQKPQEVQHQGQYVIDEMKGEITRLAGRVEDMERTQKQVNATAAAAGNTETKKLEARIIELEQAQIQMIEALKKLQDSASSSNVDPSELLDRAKNQMDAGNHEGAIENLNAYLKNPKAKRAEDATYMRAEAYFLQKEYKKAIVDFSKFPEKFTKSPRMPKALLRIGESFEMLGMKDDAKGFYQELVEKYPKTPEAKKARPKAK